MAPVAAATVWPAELAAPVAAGVVPVFDTSVCTALAALAADAAGTGVCVCWAGSPMRDWPAGAIRAATASGSLFIFAYARPPIEFATKYMANPNTVRRISTTPNWRQKTSSALLTSASRVVLHRPGYGCRRPRSGTSAHLRFRQGCRERITINGKRLARWRRDRLGFRPRNRLARSVLAFGRAFQGTRLAHAGFDDGALPYSAPSPRLAIRCGASPERFLPAPVAQLDRVLASEAKGHRFESCRARHSIRIALPHAARGVVPSPGYPDADRRRRCVRHGIGQSGAFVF